MTTAVKSACWSNLLNLENARGVLLRVFVLSMYFFAGPAAANKLDDIRDDVFVTVQRAGVTVAGKALQQAALRQEAGNEALASLLRQRQDLVDAGKSAQHKLSEAVQRQGAQAEADANSAQAELDAHKALLNELDLEIERAFPAFKELTNPRPMSREEVQNNLRPGEALLLTFSTEYDIFVWAVSKTKADWIAIDISTDEISEMVSTLRRLLDVTHSNRAAASLDDETFDISSSANGFDRSMAHEIYVQLLQPLEHVVEDADHLIAVLDGPLTSLPLAVLVADAPQGDDADARALRDTEWLITRHALTVLPNVSSLRALRRTEHKGAAGGDRQPFVGFGDPVFAYRDAEGAATGVKAARGETYVSRGTFETVQQVAGLAQLPNTARELKRLARLTGVGDDALFLGDAATETSVKDADLSRANILAFATHGLLTGELAGLGEPALVFTPPLNPSEEDDALLTASEAASLKLSAELIILSACNTAAGDGTPGAEGLSGLARAFIYAGARSILVSHWPVDDYATSVLTTGMVAAMQDGAPRATALRTSILSLMREDGDLRHAHPRYWAPFILVGEG